jgi:excisionase family DNA binding protein
VRLRKFYTTKQIADMCGVHITTAIRWIDGGELRAFRTPGGRRRVTAEDLRGFVERHKIPVLKKLRRERPLVLVVDDDPIVLRAIARQLTSADRFEVMTSSSGYDGLLVVGSQLPDLVILDLLMPRVDGFEVCSSIKRTLATSHIEVIAVTGRFTSQVEKRVLDLGAHACLPKEDLAARLVTVIDEALE